MTRRTPWKTLLFTAAASTLCGAACGDAPPPEPNADPQVLADTAPPGRQQSQRASEATPGVSVAADRATLIARGASRIALLREFAASGGFDLDIRVLDPAPVDANLVDRPLAEVAGALAGSVPYALEYEAPQAGAAHRIARLRIGAAQEAHDALEPSTAPDVTADSEPRSDDFDPRKLEPEWTQRRNELRRDFDTASESERVELVAELDTDGPDFEVLADLLANDASAQVRIAAAETLGSAGTFGAVKALLAALDDPDSAVLVAVIEGLAFSGDGTVVARLGTFTSHRDPEVRAAAEDAIHALE